MLKLAHTLRGWLAWVCMIASTRRRSRSWEDADNPNSGAGHFALSETMSICVLVKFRIATAWVRHESKA
jgi:hypothetical protein